jgi:hypothetical protein
MLHLFTFAMELNDNNGTPVFLGAPGSAKVRRSQLAFLRRIEGRSRKGDEHLLKVGTDIKWDSTCDKRLSEVFHAINTGVYDNRIPGRVDRARDNGDDFADGVRYEVPEEDDGGGGGGWGRQRRGRGRGNRRRRNGEDEDDDDENDEDESENDDDQEDIAIMSILNETLKDARGNSCEGKEIIEKVKIIVQNMRRPCADAGNQPNRDEDAGCVVFFCVMDELFSMGTPFHTLVKMGEEHRLFVSRQRKSQPVKRGQGGRPQVSEPGLIERFPFLKVCSPTLFLLSANEEMKDPDHIANGLLNFKAETYLDLAAFITNDPRMVRENREANLHSMNRMSNPGNAWNPNPMHPALLFTVEWALQTMRLYGVPRSQASMEVLKGSANWLAEQERLMIMSQFVDRWYFDPERSYHYLMAGFVWARLGSAGLESQYFPWFNVPAPLLKTSVSRSTSNALVRYEHGRGANELAPDYAEAMIIPDLGRPEVLPSKFFDPNVISRRSGIRQVSILCP